MQVFSPTLLALEHFFWLMHRYLRIIVEIEGSSVMKEDLIVSAASRPIESVAAMSFQSDPHGKTKEMLPPVS